MNWNCTSRFLMKQLVLRRYKFKTAVRLKNKVVKTVSLILHQFRYALKINVSLMHTKCWPPGRWNVNLCTKKPKVYVIFKSDYLCYDRNTSGSVFYLSQIGSIAFVRRHYTVWISICIHELTINIDFYYGFYDNPT